MRWTNEHWQILSGCSLKITENHIGANILFIKKLEKRILNMDILTYRDALLIALESIFLGNNV